MGFEQLEQELENLLVQDGIHTLFQPIVDAREALVEGYEALSRGPSDSPLHPASVLFETAERCGRTLELENLCLRTTRASWTSTRRTQKLFVNVSPDNLLPGAYEHRLLEALLEDGAIAPGQVVVELSERYPALDMEELKRSLTWLKQSGFQVAIDDLGAGYSGLKLWSEVEPDYVKIDRHFVRDIHEDPIKRECVRAVMQLSSRLNCRVVAEGVEQVQELEILRDLGVRYLQGFLFGRPRPVTGANLQPLREVSHHAYCFSEPTCSRINSASCLAGSDGRPGARCRAISTEGSAGSPLFSSRALSCGLSMSRVISTTASPATTTGINPVMDWLE